jgi:hypothetical protein
MHNRTTGDLGDPGHGTGEPHEEPEDTAKQPGCPDGPCRQGAGVTDGRRANRLHRLDRDRRFEVEARNDLEQAEGDEDPYRVELADGDIADQERDKGPEVAEGPCEFTQVIRIPAFLGYLLMPCHGERAPGPEIQISAPLHQSLLPPPCRTAHLSAAARFAVLLRYYVYKASNDNKKYSRTEKAGAKACWTMVSPCA